MAQVRCSLENKMFLRKLYLRFLIYPKVWFFATNSKLIKSMFLYPDGVNGDYLNRINCIKQLTSNTLGCIDIGISNFEFMGQFLYFRVQRVQFVKLEPRSLQRSLKGEKLKKKGCQQMQELQRMLKGQSLVTSQN